MREIDRLGAMMDSSNPVAFFFQISGQVSVPPLDPDLDPLLLGTLPLFSPHLCIQS